MPEQPISDNGNPAGNPAGFHAENNQQNQGNASKPDRKTEQEPNEAQPSRSDTGSVFNAKQAAVYLKKDEKTIRNWITSGRIHAEKQNGSWQITKAELDSVFVDEQRKQERKTEREKKSETPTVEAQNLAPDHKTERKTEQENTAPPEVRPDSAGGVGESALVQQLKTHITGQDRRLEEKDMRLAELKAGYERQVNEKDERLNEKDDRVNELKGDREQDRQMYTKLMNNAQELIHSLQSQVAQLEAPKPSPRSTVEAVDADFTEEQGSVEQGRSGPKNDPLNSDSSNSVPSVQSSPDPGEETKEPETPEQEKQAPRRRWWRW